LNDTQYYYNATSNRLVDYDTGTLPTTNSTGGYNYTLEVPAITGNYTLAINTSETGTHGKTYGSVSQILTVESDNTAPSITWVQTSLSDNPTESTTTTVWIAFNATDQDGYSDIDMSTAKIELSLTGEIQRNSTSCLAQINDTNTRMINCSINMQYYDNDGAWIINVSVEDNSNELTYNDSETFSYGILQAVRGNLTGIAFGSLSLGDTTNATNDPIMLNNTGNQNFTQINLTAYDLVGQDNSLQYIAASKLYANLSLDNYGDQLSNNTMIALTNGTLIRDRSGTDYNRNLYFWINVPASGLSNQNYTSTSSWKIEVFP